MQKWLSDINKEYQLVDNVYEFDDVAIQLASLDDNKTNISLFKKYQAEGKHLISVFPHELKTKELQLKNYIKSILNLSEIKIYARKCVIKEVNKSLANTFLFENHIQGKNKLGIVFFGLFYKEELVGIMSLGRHSRQIKENIIVLDRLCFKDNVQVIGGASKLFKFAVQWAAINKYQAIISFSDNRYSAGKIYTILGFELEREYRQDYSYIDNNGTHYSKQSQKKSSCNCPAHLTEKQWADMRGLKRIWDCGKKRWLFKIDNTFISWNERLSCVCAHQHQAGQFKHSHLRGYFLSAKNQSPIYYSSSYELRCIYLLEENTSVVKYSRGDVFEIDRRWRNPDLLVEYKDGSKEIIEIKPLARLKEVETQKQIDDSISYTAKNGLKFKIWTEEDSGLADEKAIIEWAKNHLKIKYGDEEFDKLQKKNAVERTKKHYAKLGNITVFCDFCKENHTVHTNQYKINMAKNGRFICIKENGFIQGSKSKPKKENPYEGLNQKECLKCCRALPLDCFSEGKSTCKECRAATYKKKYNEKKEWKKENGIVKGPSPLRKENPYLAEGKKKCSNPNCKDPIKPLSEFSPNKGHSDGYASRCKTCRTEAYKAKQVEKKNNEM